MAEFLAENVSIKTLATPGAPTLDYFGTAGTTDYKYKVVAWRGAAYTPASAEATYGDGYASLSTERYVKITPDFQEGVTRFDIYRTLGGEDQGKIGSVAPQNVGGVQLAYLLDVGQASDEQEPPTVGNMGGLTVEGAVVMLPNLPTADPLVVGQVWNNGGVLTVSEGD